MKRFMLIIFVTFSLDVSAHAGWFNHETEQKEKERRQHAEEQLSQAQQSNARLQNVIHWLSASVTVALVMGAAMGSKTRRDA